MGLRLKFNLILFLVFLVGFGVTGWVSHELLQRNARDEIVRNAGLMMEAALAIRGYTVTQIRPHLEMQLMRVFLPQSVPAYAATETINELRKTHPDYSYKEATLNPTNPRNRATDWEADLIQTFRNDAAQKELMGERDTPTGRSLYIARPIQIKNPACLACHSVPSAAASLTTAAGRAAGGVNDQLAARAEHLLAVHIGPMAKILVKKAARNARGAQDFIAALAETIEDDDDRAAFLAAAEKEFLTAKDLEPPRRQDRQESFSILNRQDAKRAEKTHEKPKHKKTKNAQRGPILDHGHGSRITGG